MCNIRQWNNLDQRIMFCFCFFLSNVFIVSDNAREFSQAWHDHPVWEPYCSTEAQTGWIGPGGCEGDGEERISNLWIHLVCSEVSSEDEVPHCKSKVFLKLIYSDNR